MEVPGRVHVPVGRFQRHQGQRCRSLFHVVALRGTLRRQRTMRRSPDIQVAAPNFYTVETIRGPLWQGGDFFWARGRFHQQLVEKQNSKRQQQSPSLAPLKLDQSVLAPINPTGSGCDVLRPCCSDPIAGQHDVHVTGRKHRVLMLNLQN